MEIEMEMEVEMEMESRKLLAVLVPSKLQSCFEFCYRFV